MEPDGVTRLYLTKGSGGNKPEPIFTHDDCFHALPENEAAAVKARMDIRAVSVSEARRRYFIILRLSANVRNLRPDEEINVPLPQGTPTPHVAQHELLAEELEKRCGKAGLTIVIS